MKNPNEKIETETRQMIVESSGENGEIVRKVISFEVFGTKKYGEPRMLIVEELLSDLEANCNEIEKYTKNINEDNFKCNFIYAYSLFEGALWQLAKSILYAFHEKLKSEKVQFGEDGEVSFDGSDMLESFIEEKLKMISTGKLANHFEEIMKIVEVRVNFDKDILNNISRARNSIVHTNTTKAENKENRAELPKHAKKSDIEKYMKELKHLLDDVYKAISHKYKDYTQKRLLEDAWNYTVGGYMSFETLIGFDKSFDNKIAVRPNFDTIEEAFKGFCSTEKAMLSIWLQQYGSDNLYDIFKENKPFKAWAWLDRKKLIFLATLFNRFPYLMDGHDFASELQKEKNNG